jgi:hypothetical protein
MSLEQEPGLDSLLPDAQCDYNGEALPVRRESIATQLGAILSFPTPIPPAQGRRGEGGGSVIPSMLSR